MAKIKIIWGDWLKKIKEKIKKSNMNRLIKSKSIIKDLENDKNELIKKNQLLIDKNRILNLKIRGFDKKEKTTRELKKEINELQKIIDTSKNLIADLRNVQCKLECELFESNQELVRCRIQCEEYENQINDYKTEGRYLVKKIPTGRTPNTIKTKISKPMSGNVVKYMREEHE